MCRRHVGYSQRSFSLEETSYACDLVAEVRLLTRQGYLAGGFRKRRREQRSYQVEGGLPCLSHGLQRAYQKL